MIPEFEICLDLDEIKILCFLKYALLLCMSAFLFGVLVKLGAVLGTSSTSSSSSWLEPFFIPFLILQLFRKFVFLNVPSSLLSQFLWFSSTSFQKGTSCFSTLLIQPMNPVRFMSSFLFFEEVVLPPVGCLDKLGSSPAIEGEFLGCILAIWMMLSPSKLLEPSGDFSGRLVGIWSVVS